MRVLAWPGPMDENLTNPYISLVYSGMQDQVALTSYNRWRGGRPQDVDVLHVHWPEAILWGRAAHKFGGLPARYAGWRLNATARGVRRRGGAVAWTVHNLEPHDALTPGKQRIWERTFSAFRKQVDVCLHLSNDAKTQALARFPDIADRHHVITPHPHFRDAYPVPPGRDEALARLDLPPEPYYIGIIGSIRPNKGALPVLQAFKACAREDERLIIAGACPDQQYWQQIAQAAQGDPRVIVRRGFLSEQTLADYFGLIAVYVMNFEYILNSGGVMLALSFNTPVICPSRGSLNELAAQVGHDWVATYDEAFSVDVLRHALDRVRAAPRPPQAPLDAFAPEAISALTLEAYGAGRA